MPLSVIVDSGNRNDLKPLADTLLACEISIQPRSNNSGGYLRGRPMQASFLENEPLHQDPAKPSTAQVFKRRKNSPDYTPSAERRLSISYILRRRSVRGASSG